MVNAIELVLSGGLHSFGSAGSRGTERREPAARGEEASLRWRSASAAPNGDS